MNMLEKNGVDFIVKTPELTVQRYTVTEDFAQIHGVLHGGIAAAIAEQGASMGANLAMAPKRIALGLSMETHHLQRVDKGTLCEARAWPEQQGGRIQVWRVEQRMVESNELFNISTVTLYGKDIPG